MKNTNATFELNQIFTDIEKLVVYVEKEKQSLLSKKETSTSRPQITVFNENNSNGTRRYWT